MILSQINKTSQSALLGVFLHLRESVPLSKLDYLVWIQALLQHRTPKMHSHFQSSASFAVAPAWPTCTCTDYTDAYFSFLLCKNLFSSPKQSIQTSQPHHCPFQRLFSLIIFGTIRTVQTYNMKDSYTYIVSKDLNCWVVLSWTFLVLIRLLLSFPIFFYSVNTVIPSTKCHRYSFATTLYPNMSSTKRCPVHEPWSLLLPPTDQFESTECHSSAPWTICPVRHVSLYFIIQN